MRLALLASTILGLAVSGQATAQDLTSGDVPTGMASWTGFYAGIQYGLAAADSNVDVDFVATGANFFDEDIDDIAIIGGLYLGYTQQLGNFILGVEATSAGCRSTTRIPTCSSTARPASTTTPNG